jgi:hypothetical protein
MSFEQFAAISRHAGLVDGVLLTRKNLADIFFLSQNVVGNMERE